MTNLEKNLTILCIALFTIAAVLMAGMFSEAHALDWHTANQTTVGWDSVPYELDENERLVYRVMVVNQLTDPGKTAPEVVAEVPDTPTPTYTLTLNIKGSYLVGVKSVVQVQSADGAWTDVAESETASWSDLPESTGGNPFGIRFYPAPPAPINLRLSDGES